MKEQRYTAKSIIISLDAVLSFTFSLVYHFDFKKRMLETQLKLLLREGMATKVKKKKKDIFLAVDLSKD